MNIQKILSVKFNTHVLYNTGNNDSANRANSGIKMSQPLKADTISFLGRGKKIVPHEVRAAIARKQARLIRDARLIEEAKTEPTKKDLSGSDRIWGVPLETAKMIPQMIEATQKQIHDFMGRIFGDLLVSEVQPNNLLLCMSDRAKSELSIMEKSATRKLNSVQEILDTQIGMTDLNGAKTVMNYKTGQPESELVLSRYIPLIKTGLVRLREIEVQLPEGIKHSNEKDKEEFYYVSKEFLDKLEDAQEEVINGLEDDPEKIVLINRPLPKYTKGNYCALHLLMELVQDASKPFDNPLRWTRPFEHQHMGARENKGKKLDDKRFKFFDGKEIGEEYEALKKPWRLLLEEENKPAKERFLQYSKDANLQLRKDEIQEYKTQRLVNRNGNVFITVRDYNLTPEYDLNNLYAIMQDCDKRAAKKSKERINDNTVKQSKIGLQKNKNSKNSQKNASKLTPQLLIKLSEKYGVNNKVKSSNKNNLNTNKNK